MVTSNVLQRVFRIYFNRQTASAYTIEKGDRQFLVSAAHTFSGDHVVDELMIFHEEKWKALKVKVVFNSLDYGDTIVFALQHDISPRHPVEYGIGSVIHGSWANILGFPLGMFTNSGELNNKFPFPFIKAGLVSSIKIEKPNLQTIYLDGHNNKGFSGGPVVWSPNPLSKPFKIIGTISGYLNEPVLASESHDEDSTYISNAGIIVAYWIKDLFDQI